MNMKPKRTKETTEYRGGFIHKWLYINVCDKNDKHWSWRVDYPNVSLGGDYDSLENAKACIDRYKKTLEEEKKQIDKFCQSYKLPHLLNGPVLLAHDSVIEQFVREWRKNELDPWRSENEEMVEEVDKFREKWANIFYQCTYGDKDNLGLSRYTDDPHCFTMSRYYSGMDSANDVATFVLLYAAMGGDEFGAKE